MAGDSNNSRNREITDNRTYWRDFNGEEEPEEKQTESSTPLFEPLLQPSELPHGEALQVLTEEEQRFIHHAPGRSEQSQSSRLATEDKIRLTGTLCDQLNLLDYQKREAQKLMAELNLDRFGNQKRIEKVALVIIRYITDRDRHNNATEYRARISSNDRYLDLIEQYGMDLGDVMRLSNLVKQQLQDQELIRD